MLTQLKSKLINSDITLIDSRKDSDLFLFIKRELDSFNVYHCEDAPVKIKFGRYHFVVTYIEEVNFNPCSAVFTFVNLETIETISL